MLAQDTQLLPQANPGQGGGGQKGLRGDVPWGDGPWESLWLHRLCLVLPTPPSCDSFPFSSQDIQGLWLSQPGL